MFPALLSHPLSVTLMRHAQVIGIDVDDPLAKDLNDIGDVEELLPGYVSGIREWFRWYKTPDDKPLNAFGFGEKALGKVSGKHPAGTGTMNPTRGVTQRGATRKRAKTRTVGWSSFIVRFVAHSWHVGEMTYMFSSLFFFSCRMRR